MRDMRQKPYGRSSCEPRHEPKQEGLSSEPSEGKSYGGRKAEKDKSLYPVHPLCKSGQGCLGQIGKASNMVKTRARTAEDAEH